MANSKAQGTGDPGARQARRQVARLERRLGRLAAQEARRSRKLSRTQQRVRVVEERLRELRGASSTGGDPAGARPAVAAYCLRERRRISMIDAVPVTLRNGRSALAGTCPGCGARVVSLAARQA